MVIEVAPEKVTESPKLGKPRMSQLVRTRNLRLA
jgi:hypothetical protein